LKKHLNITFFKSGIHRRYIEVSTVIRAVFFDFGGVLTETCWDLKVMADLIYKAFKENNIELPPEFEQVFMKVMEERWIRVLKTQREERLEDILMDILHILNIPYNKNAVDLAIDYIMDAPFCIVRKEAKTVLEELRKMGIKMGIISNSPIAFHERVLAKHGLLEYFDAIIVSCEVSYRKPHPKIFEIALEKLGVKASESIFVGDAPAIDIPGAKKVGMKSVLIKYGDPAITKVDQYITASDPIEPDYIIENLSEIIDIIRKENKVS